MAHSSRRLQQEKYQKTIKSIFVPLFCSGNLSHHATANRVISDARCKLSSSVPTTHPPFDPSLPFPELFEHASEGLDLPVLQLRPVKLRDLIGVLGIKRRHRPTLLRFFFTRAKKLGFGDVARHPSRRVCAGCRRIRTKPRVLRVWSPPPVWFAYNGPGSFVC